MIRRSPVLQDVGGEGEIRTHESIATLVVFKTTALGHYATSPIIALALNPALRGEAEEVGFEPTRPLFKVEV